jgi:phage regulator Rha-like protein
MFGKSVTSIMADFVKKIDDLEKLKAEKNREIQDRTSKISYLKGQNHEDQCEISLADRVINSLNAILK